MGLRANTWLPAAIVFVAAAALADEAAAQCGPVCPPPPPPPSCCDQPPPPPCCGGGGNLNVNVNVNANANANASASARGGATVIVAGGGGAYVNVEQPYPTAIQGLNVQGHRVRQMVRVPYEARRRVSKRVVIRAVCLDDRGRPHPAAQVRPDRDIWDAYEGELFRCVAGTYLQITVADWQGHENFDFGETTVCRKGDALWFGGGVVECRTQRPERECNERSLLRRYGVGVKVVTMWSEEIYTEYREEEVISEGWAVSGGSIVLDGGVGGRVF